MINLIYDRRKTLLFNTISYLVLGLTLFCYTLVGQLGFLRDQISSPISRPLNYYIYHIKEILITLNGLSFIFRIIGSVLLFLLFNQMNTIDKIIKMQLEEKLFVDENSTSQEDRLFDPESPSSKKAINQVCINRDIRVSQDNFISRRESNVYDSSAKTDTFSSSYDSKFNSESYYKKMILKE